MRCGIGVLRISTGKADGPFLGGIEILTARGGTSRGRYSNRDLVEVVALALVETGVPEELERIENVYAASEMVVCLATQRSRSHSITILRRNCVDSTASGIQAPGGQVLCRGVLF